MTRIPREVGVAAVVAAVVVVVVVAAAVVAAAAAVVARAILPPLVQLRLKRKRPTSYRRKKIRL